MRISASFLRCTAFAAITGLVFPVAAQAQSEFRGGGFSRTLTAACPQGIGDVSSILIRARPAGEAGNSATDTRVSLFFGTFAAHFSVNDAALQSGRWVPVNVSAHVGSAASYYTQPTPGSSAGTSVRGMPIPGGAVLRGDERHLVAEIANFDFVRGCTVRVGGVVRRRL